MSVFDAGNNLFFCRRSDGSVRILKYITKPSPMPKPESWVPAHAVEVDVTVNPGVWAAAVTEVSLQRTTAERFYQAAAFHDNPGCPEQQLKQRPRKP